MNLSVGIVGLPNVGKSTLFNALLKKQQAFVANYPFATIEPNIGIVPVPDPRLEQLAQTVKQSEKLGCLPPEVPATIKFVDIAGLVSGAHKGEGLGNKFLAHIRETDLICHVLRDFSDPNVTRAGLTSPQLQAEAGSVNPQNDLVTLRTELILADLQTLGKQTEPKGQITPDEKYRFRAVQKIKPILEQGYPATKAELSDEEAAAARELFLLTAKPELFVINTDETRINQDKTSIAKTLGVGEGSVIILSAQTESELSLLSQEEQQEYLTHLGVTQSGLDQMIQTAYRTLGLISFLTAGPKEVRAWTIPQNTPAVSAAAVIHTDFAPKFIKVDTIPYQEFISLGGWAKARNLGKVTSHGRDYPIQDGDVVEFKIGA